MWSPRLAWAYVSESFNGQRRIDERTMHQRLKQHRERRRRTADQRMFDNMERDADRQHYAHLLGHGHADASTIGELKTLGRKLGRSEELIERDLLALKEADVATSHTAD
jgi:hypothetical protein